MRFEERSFVLKDGRSLSLRENGPEHAEEMIEYLKVTAGESPFLLRYPDEITFPLDAEKKLLADILSDPRALMMIAMVDGELAGNCSFSPLGSARRLKHRCDMAIALKKKYCGLGIGTIMISRMIELAGEAGYSQMELQVVEGNEGAKRLYERMGFIETGRYPRALKYDDGTYRDEIFMCRLL